MNRCRQSAEVEGTYASWRDAPGYDTVTLKLSFGGDCTFGRNAGAAYAGSVDAMYDKMGSAYFFSNVKEFHSDDLTMVNLEGALTTFRPAQGGQGVCIQRAAGICCDLERGQRGCGYHCQQSCQGLWRPGLGGYDPRAFALCGGVRLCPAACHGEGRQNRVCLQSGLEL